jgi:hypothetical protein
MITEMTLFVAGVALITVGAVVRSIWSRLSAAAPGVTRNSHGARALPPAGRSSLAR